MAATPPIRALAVDDEPLAIERLQILCARLPQVQLIGSANDAASALRLIDATAPELLLLDIAMPGMTGLELARALNGRVPAIVFITAYDQFAVAAFDVAAADYLLKPIDPERLALAIGRAAERLRAPAAPAPSVWLQEFWVPHRGEIIRVAAADIEHVEAERDYMRLHCGGRSFLIHETISALEARLDPGQFVRIHRSAIVRRDQIARLAHDRNGGWRVALSNGADLPVGRSYAANVKALAGRA